MSTYIFDIDGTLTPSRGLINPEFLTWFYQFNQKHKVRLVTGSDKKKTIEQIGVQLFNAVDCVYNTSGNTKHINGKCVYQASDFILDEYPRKWLDRQLLESEYPVRTGRHFEIRPGLLNFSIVGRKATTDQRREYALYDGYRKERVSISKEFNKKFAVWGLESQVAGETGLDIIEIGKDKAQILKECDYSESILFFGDNIQPGGNDYGIAQAIKYGPYKFSEVYSVKNWKQTYSILKRHQSSSK